MTQHTVVIETCRPKTANEEVIAQVASMLAKLPGLDERLGQAKRIFIKLNLGIKGGQTYKNRPIAYTDPAVYEGVATYLQGRTEADVLVGDGTDTLPPADAAREHGHMAVADRMGHRFVDPHEPPFARFHVPEPAMFRWYDLSAELQDVDLFVSLAKMKSHHLCGVTLTMKNLFGLPPGPVYGSPRFMSLHSAVRLPRILADLNGLFRPGLCLVDGIIGANYMEWGGDPVTSGVLIAGDNPVATDATAARFMGVDPDAMRGTAPFLRADNHIRLAADLGLGSTRTGDIDLVGDMPTQRRPYAVEGSAEPHTLAQAEAGRRAVCRQAQQYFENRDHYVQAYADEAIVMDGDKVVVHGPTGEVTWQATYEALDGDPVRFYGAFAKLVQEEEAELREPYAV